MVLPEAAEPYVVTQKLRANISEVEHSTWKYLYELRMRQLRELACAEYLQGLTALGITRRSHAAH